MAQKAPDKHFRKGMSLKELLRLFPNDDIAGKWFAEVRWPDGLRCPYCGWNNIQSGAAHKTIPCRCRKGGCRKRFSVRISRVMKASPLGSFLQTRNTS